MRLLLPLLLVTASILPGCEARGPAASTVSGQVTLDGQPLASGMVQFHHLEKKTVSSASIKDGKYSGSVYQGKLRVEITSPKVVGQRKAYDTPDSPMVDVTKEQVPAKFNTKSELTAEVKPGENALDFDLKTK